MLLIAMHTRLAKYINCMQSRYIVAYVIPQYTRTISI